MISTMNKPEPTFGTELVYSIWDAFGMRTFRAKGCHGDTNSPTGLSVSDTVLSQRDVKPHRLYERGASKKRIGPGLAWWLGCWGLCVGLTGGAHASTICTGSTDASSISGDPAVASDCRRQSSGTYVAIRYLSGSNTLSVALYQGTDFLPNLSGTQDVDLGFTSVFQLVDTGSTSYSGDCASLDYASATDSVAAVASNVYCAKGIGGSDTIYMRAKYVNSPSDDLVLVDGNAAWFGSSTATFANLGAFSASPHPASIRLDWMTLMEMDNAGFIVWRGQLPNNQTECSRKAEDYTDVKPIAYLSAVGDATAYSYEDTDVIAGNTYCYALEDIDLFGNSTFHLDDITSATVP
jgi:hypothetical protein